MALTPEQFKPLPTETTSEEEAQGFPTYNTRIKTLRTPVPEIGQAGPTYKSEEEANAALAAEEQARLHPVAPVPATTTEDEIRTSLAAVQKSITDLTTQQEATINAEREKNIASIKEQAAITRQQQTDINKRTLAAVRISQIRSGGLRYAPEIAGGILSGEESAGLQRLQEIDAKEKSLIAQAESAASTKQFSILKERMDDLRTTASDKVKALNEILKESQKKEAEATKAKKQSEKENSILELRNKGITDPFELHSVISKFYPDVTVDEVSKVLKLYDESKNSLGAEFERYKFFAGQRGEAVTQQGYLDFRTIESAAGRAAESNKPLGVLDIARYTELYPEAGVVAGDTEVQANAKVAAINTPEAKTRALIQGLKDNNVSYENVVKEIDNDTTIEDKETTKKIAQEVYGVTPETIAATAIYGRGQFANIDINDSLTELKNGNYGLDIRGNPVKPSNTFLANELLKRGYPNDEIRKLTSGVFETFANAISDFLFR